MTAESKNPVRSLCALLFVPGDRPERLQKAMHMGADALIIDLEDAVAPSAKSAARETVANLVNESGRPIFARVNAAGTPWHGDDISAVRGQPALAGVMIPKAEDVEGLTALGDLAVVALVETALGLSRLRAIASAPPVTRLAFGSLDYCVDMGMRHTREALQAARAEFVLASRLAGLPAPIDGVTLSLENPRQTEEDARYARELGFGGKLAIHPGQLAAIRLGFAPSADEVRWARAIQAAGAEGAVRVDGAMVDAPLRALADSIVSQVDAAAD